MPQHSKARIFSAFALSAVLLVSAIATTVFAHNGNTNSAAAVTSSAKPATSLHIVNLHTVDMSKVPQATKAELSKGSHAMPLLTPRGAAAYQQWQHSNRGSAAPHNAGSSLSANTPSPAFPNVYNNFQGQTDSAATCPYFGGCQPPDMGLAASPAGLALQSVNTSLSLFNEAGTVQLGWPKTAQAFFGVGDPGTCDPNGPFLSDPRSWYDPYQNRWGEAELQVEGAFGLNSCPEQTLYWIATSQSSDPNGLWTVFAINMAFGSDATAAADYTQFGFNGDGIYVSANMFNQAGTAYDYAEIAGCSKIFLYYGGTLKCNGWFGFAVSGSVTVAIDTLNPTQQPANTDFAARSEFFVSSFNSPDPFGNDCVTHACHGASVWSWSDPGNVTGHGNLVSGAFVDTNTYLEPPAADQPSCTGGHGGCVESLDNRVSATPVYHSGRIYAAHVTGITNASAQFVPGIQWWDFRPTLKPGYPTSLAGVGLGQDAYLNAKNNFTACTFPVMMSNVDGDIIMGYDYMGDTIFPSINITMRRVTDPANVMTGGLGVVELSGTVSTTNSRWGDYEAMSYTAPYQDFVWFSSEYANPSASGDWTTRIFRMRLDIGS